MKLIQLILKALMRFLGSAEAATSISRFPRISQSRIVSAFKHKAGQAAMLSCDTSAVLRCFWGLKISTARKLVERYSRGLGNSFYAAIDALVLCKKISHFMNGAQLVKSQTCLTVIGRALNMNRIESPPCRRVASTIFVGTNRRGNWVAREVNGAFGGLFVNRAHAFKYALFESGYHPETIVEVSREIELDIPASPGTRRMAW